MSQFNFAKKFSLDFLGEAWKAEGHLMLNPMTPNEIASMVAATPDTAALDAADRKISDMASTLQENVAEIAKRFVSGKGIDADGNVVDLVAEDLGNFPLEVIGKAIDFISGNISPN